MRTTRAFSLVLASIALLGASLATVAPVAATAVDPLGDELMRLTNLDRVALGKTAYAVDPTLVSFARDLPFTCPTDPSMTIHGRAVDMAERNYFAHTVAGCLKADGTPISVLEVMLSPLGYNTNRAENIAWNRGYGEALVTYQVGCAIDRTACTSTTTSPSTVATAESGLMMSVGHRATILGTYDRFGCGSGTGADGGITYACVFSLGGSTAPAPVPTPTPTPAPALTPAPTTAPPIVAVAPIVAPDRTAPRVVRTSGLWTGRAYIARRVAVVVTDDRALSRLTLLVDGRTVAAWKLSGRAVTKLAVIPGWRLRGGRHLVRWVVRDLAGNTRTWSGWLYVR